ncbi:MAG: hypothetical protein GY847_33020, partial [Proteobacteria bacterium]|nr:hypothetical protein [Pseudomonadota bacterium]
THEQYLEHLNKHITSREHDDTFNELLRNHQKAFEILTELNLDPAKPVLDRVYCPAVRVVPRPPLTMLRSLIQMTMLKETSITKWVARTRTVAFYAVLAGFEPDDTPGVGTYYDFMRRIIDGPYRKPSEDRVLRSRFNAGRHKRNIKKEKEKKADEICPNQTRSEILVRELLNNENQPRPDGFEKTLEDLLFSLGIAPSVAQGLITDIDSLVISGDGSIMATAASSAGRPACECRAAGIYNCDHDRFFTSPTAQQCYDHHHNCFVFGDRYYHLVVTQNGHDFPLLTVMPGGNESDYTLSLKAFDRFVKAADENGLPARVSAFIGDGHHDSYAHYEYFAAKQVIPIIPLTKTTQPVYPHASEAPNAPMLDSDGVPLCPVGLRMRHHQFNKNKQTHVYTCPAKRSTHRNGKTVYVFHPDDCSEGWDCKPDSSIGPLIYIKSDADRRLFPPIPRTSPKFKALKNQRSASERLNFINDTYNLDNTCHNADYALFRLTLVNIIHHAMVRYDAAKPKDSR